MKFGVAFSGSGESAANAHCFLEELGRENLPLGMLSATSLAVSILRNASILSS